MLCSVHLIPLLVLTYTCCVLSRPAGSDEDWEVGRLPTSGHVDDSLWGPTTRSSSDESSLRSDHGQFGADPWAGISLPPFHHDWDAIMSWSHDGPSSPAFPTHPEASGSERGSSSLDTQVDQPESHPAPIHQPAPVAQPPLHSTTVPWGRVLLQRDEAAEEVWKQRIRRSLGLKNLQISEAGQRLPIAGGVYVAEDESAMHELHPPLPNDVINKHYGRANRGPFLARVEGANTHSAAALRPSEQSRGIYMYLNSRAHLDELNQHYFLNHLVFLPVVKERLTFSELRKLHLARRKHYVFPPARPNGLSLIIDSHNSPTPGSSSSIIKLTGRERLGQTVSLWSPSLFDGEVYTTVLYGIALLDTRSKWQVVEHLERLTATADPASYSSVYDVQELIRPL
ncbi:hypothetical protein PSEUBRA_006038 [Kalmanozyma brasiliensis GHG001]|uniref:uncharacterized protein n=1 Tax=Kalmanozyma brasiliensis (strain GHG001) TaxID=1365824 RepID=UPI001CE7E2F2|nr:uncharacterized protein PSEUBRA_006038 [Kalmanozyma brasiliensis GHG001]KAF6767602.1 hypothetical protein PSEUBRA_006038 [Kalmanozyma brasiliensis GHG001]